MKKSFRKELATTLTLLASALALQPALGANILEEVTVTAQKREENLQDVPLAVTAFTGAQMAAMGVQESFDIATFTPGVHISGNLAGQNTQFSIRGVTQNDFNDIIEAPNAVYLDEGYIAIAQGQTFAVFDIDRVEILKGPQGTLFGRNATGGAVNYVSMKPDFEKTGGYLDMRASSTCPTMPTATPLRALSPDPSATRRRAGWRFATTTRIPTWKTNFPRASSTLHPVPTRAGTSAMMTPSPAGPRWRSGPATPWKLP